MTTYNVSEFWLDVAVTGELKDLPEDSTFYEVTLGGYLEFVTEAIEKLGKTLCMRKCSNNTWDLMAGNIVIAWAGVTE